LAVGLFRIRLGFGVVAVRPLKPILKLQAATRDDDTRIWDLRPVCDNRGLRIGAASLSVVLYSNRFFRTFGAPRNRCAAPTRGEDTKRNLKHDKDRAANLADATRHGNLN
jgi:hypothetical protein